MNEENAYIVEMALGFEDVANWWYGSKNPFSHHGYYPMPDGRILLMAEVTAENESLLANASWCFAYEPCRVDSPQVGDAAPAGPYIEIDGGEQLLWVS